MMELVLALAIGVLSASGVWLLLRPRTFQVIMGLSLLSYAVNIFIFAMGRLRSGAPPVLAGDVSDPARYTDPTPQALPGRDAPVRASEDTDSAWGADTGSAKRGSGAGENDERLRRDVPPHW